MENIVQIIESIKWPVVIVITLFIFRKPISNIIPYLNTIKYRNFEAKFGRNIKQLEKDAKNLPCSVRIKDTDYKVDKNLLLDSSNRYFQLAKIDPISAVLDAWRDLSFTIFEKAKELNIKEKHSLRKIVGILNKKGILHISEKNMFEKLYRLRNQALYEGRPNLSFIDAITYSHLAKILASYIKKLSKI